MTLFQSPDRGDPRLRLVFLICMLLGLVAGLGYLGNLSRAYYSRYPAPEQQVMKQADGDPFRNLEPADEIDPVAFQLAELGERNPDQGAIIDMQNDGVRAIYRWLMGYSHEEIAAMTRGRGRWHVTKLVREPSVWRGQLLHVYGMLADVETIEFHHNPAGIQYLYLLRLYDQHEMEFFSVLTPEMPENARVFQDKEEGQWEQWGDTLACDAVFLMNLPYRRPGRRVRTTPLFVTKRAYLSVQGRTPRIRFDERDDPGREYIDIEPEKTVPALDIDFIRDKVFSPPRDGGGWQFFGTDFRREATNLREEKTAFDHVFEYLWGQEEESIRQRARNPEINHRTLMAGNEPPSWMVGQLTRVRGTVAAVEPMRFSPELPGLPRIYILTVQDTSFRQPAEHTWAIAVPNLPEGLKWGDLIEANGVFLKNYPYRTRDNRWQWAPLVAARAVELLPPPISPLLPSYMTRTQAYILAAVVCAILLGVFFLMYRANRRDTEKLKEARKRKQDALIAAQRRKLQEARQNGQAPIPPIRRTATPPVRTRGAKPASPDPGRDTPTTETEPPTPPTSPAPPPLPDVSDPGFMNQLVHRAVHPVPPAPADGHTENPPAPDRESSR